MNTIFRDQYPLSPRKFVKKMSGEFIGGFFLCLILGAIPTGIFFVIYSTTHLDLSGYDGFIRILWTGTLWTLGFFIIRTTGYWFYWKSYIKNYFYDCSDTFITIKKGVFSPTEIHVQYQKIQDVYVDQDIIDRILGLYDVHIASATVSSGIEAHIDGVDKDTADRLKELLFSKIRGDSSSPTGSARVASTTMVQTSAPVVFSREISSNAFPMSSNWFALVATQGFFSSVVFTFFIALIPARIYPLLGWDMYAIGLVLLVIFFLNYTWRLIYAYLWKKNFSFSFSSEYITTKIGIFAKEEKHLPLKAVQDIQVRQGLFDRVFGVYSVSIENAASSMIRVSSRTVVNQNAIVLPYLSKDSATTITEEVKRVVFGSSTNTMGL